MSQITEVRSAEVIAAEINSIKGQTRDIVLMSSIEIGRRLVEAKELVAHGEWTKWLQESVDYSHSTANNLMNLYKEYGTDASKIPTLGNMSYTKALALLGVPEEEREAFVQEHDVESMSARELQDVIKEKKQLEKQLKDAEKAQNVLAQQLAEQEKNANKYKEQFERQEQLVDSLSNQLYEAKAAGDSDEANQLQEALNMAQAKIKQLEEDLKTKPIDIPQVVEKVPEEIERELEELRKKVTQSNSVSTIKFKVQFDSLVAGFREILATLDEVEKAEPEQHEKYKNAISGLLTKMNEKL